MYLMKECCKCTAHGVRFRRGYDVVDFLEGYADSPVWIVGINPAAPQEWEDDRTVGQLRTTFYEHSRKVPYFRDFGRVSPWLYSLLGKPCGVAHTDLVKCSSRSWPPPDCSKKAVSTIVTNCSPYLREQISRFRPRLIICNGSQVSAFIQREIPAVESIYRGTCYRSTVDGVDVWIVLPGFIGRIDNYSRARLGLVIERVAETIGVKTPATGLTE
jgi:hypothetical protein